MVCKNAFSLLLCAPYFPVTVVASSSHFRELDEIKAALEQSKKIRGIKKFFLRKDLSGKVKQYNDKLSTVIEIFLVCRWFAIRIIRLTCRLQAALAIDSRLAQHAEGLKVRICSISIKPRRSIDIFDRSLIVIHPDPLDRRILSRWCLKLFILTVR
jgi:hypothetical protein